MARAKRTDRSEARRRYRAQIAARDAAALGDEPVPGEEAEGSTAGRRTAGGAGSAAQPATSRGIRWAFRESFRPLDLRGDLEFLPRLVRDKSVLVPVAVSAISTVLLFGTGSRAQSADDVTTGGPLAFLAIFLFQYFVVSPPVGSAFLAGFMAPRASWLAGGIAGVVAAICLASLVYSPSFANLVAEDVRERDAIAIQGFVLSPIGSAVFASAAAWYRRFLNLANPNRGRRPAGPGARAGTGSRPGARGSTRTRPGARRR